MLSFRKQKIVNKLFDTTLAVCWLVDDTKIT